MLSRNTIVVELQYHVANQDGVVVEQGYRTFGGEKRKRKLLDGCLEDKCEKRLLILLFLRCNAIQYKSNSTPPQ